MEVHFFFAVCSVVSLLLLVPVRAQRGNSVLLLEQVRTQDGNSVLLTYAVWQVCYSFPDFQLTLKIQSSQRFSVVWELYGVLYVHFILLKIRVFQSIQCTVYVEF